MQTIHISLSNLLALSSLEEKVIAVFYGSWHYRALDKVVSSLNQYPSHMVKELFVVKSEGHDEVETYAIDTLRVNSLPFIVVFSRGVPVQGNENWSELIQHIYSPELHTSPLWKTFQPSVNYLSLILNDNEQANLNLPVSNNDCLLLFISGDRSSVGKSTISLMILASLVSQGVDVTHLAYIKPVTQCEATQPVTTYCQHVGISTIETSPVIFYQGFTRSYLAGETESAEEMLRRIRSTVGHLSRGKKLIVMDGVGYPSVGSICSISNADVARFLQAPVLLIGKPGVGDAVDSYNLLAAFFEHHGVRVLGAIFNKLELEGFYSLENCRSAISSYFAQRKLHQMPYGFIPKASGLRGLEHLKIVDSDTGHSDIDYALLSEWTKVFLEHVNLQRLIFDLWILNISKNSSFHLSSTVLSDSSQQQSRTSAMDVSQPSLLSPAQMKSNSSGISSPSLIQPPQQHISIPRILDPQKAISTANTSLEQSRDALLSNRLSGGKRSREEIEAISRAQGAKRQQ